MLLCLDSRTKLRVYNTGNKVGWEVVREIDGRQRVILRGPAVAKADFDVKALRRRLTNVRISDSVAVRTKEDDQEE